MTVDGILAAGQYMDRRGQVWLRCPIECFLGGGWFCRSAIGSARKRAGWHLPESEMRLLIERDQHRDECPGLNACNGHPVPSVITPIAWGNRDYEVYAAWANTASTFKQSLPAAMDAARALAVGE